MIDSIDAFRANLAEIDVLHSYALLNEKKIQEYRLFNKVAVVLLCTSFEVMVESFIAEHTENLLLCYDNLTLPQFMKDNYINDTIKYLMSAPVPSQKKKQLRALFQLHGNKSIQVSTLSDLVLEMRFSIGKHGQKETERIFTKFGLKSFIESSSFISAFGTINSAVAMRNNIIHEGSTPSLTHVDVENYKDAFLEFSSALENHMILNQRLYYGKNIY